MLCREITLHLNHMVDAGVIDREKPDHVILATGATPMLPPIPGIGLPHVVQAWDVLGHKVYTGKRVVVIGGGAVGVETALFLAEKGTISGDTLKFLMVNRAENPDTLYELAVKGTKQVTLIEMIGQIGKDFGKSTRWGMLQDVNRFGIATRTATRALEITDTAIRVEAGDTVEEIPADTVVIAAGSRPDNVLAQLLTEKNIAHTVIGDAAAIGMAFDAVHQGFKAGMEI